MFVVCDTCLASIMTYDNRPTCFQKQPLHRHFQRWWLEPKTEYIKFNETTEHERL